MNAGGRKVGSKNRYRATRRQSQAEKEAQNKKAQATKAANKEKKRKAEEDEAERQKQRNRARFQGFLSGSQTSATSATSSSAAAAAARGDCSNSNPNGRAAGSSDNRAGGSTPPQENNGCADKPVVITHQTISRLSSLLDEVNDLIRPRDVNEMDGAAEVAPGASSATTAIPAEQSTNQVPRPSQIGLSHTWTRVCPAQSLPAPSLEGLSHHSFQSIGNQAVGTYPSQPLLGPGKHCQRCLQFGSHSTSGNCKGRGGVLHCNNFDQNGNRKKSKRNCKNCTAHGDHVNCGTCPGRGGVRYCSFYPIDDLTPKPRQKPN